MKLLTVEDRIKLERSQKGLQRWQRALTHWERLGKDSRILALSFRLQDIAMDSARSLDGEIAFKLARLQIERSPQDGQQLLSI